MERVFTLENINEVAKDLWNFAGDGSVIAFHGPVGAGKTTLVHALCDVKGVKDIVGSPSFSIINEYDYPTIDKRGRPCRKKIFHLDLYRVKDEEEAIRAGVEDVLYSGEFCLVEWPEKAPGIFPPNSIHAVISVINGQTRRIKIGNI